MRHSAVTLTLGTYGHLLPDEAAQTVARMPELEPTALRLTGTANTPADANNSEHFAPIGNYAVGPATAGQRWANPRETV